jgi:hypothetical protein
MNNTNVQKYIELVKGMRTLFDKNDDKFDEYEDRLEDLWKIMSSSERAYINALLRMKKI